MSWLFPAVPRGRVAVFRALIYLYVAIDLAFITTWVPEQAAVGGPPYQPLWLERMTGMPAPSPWLAEAVHWSLLLLALVAASGRAPRLLGWAVFVGYFEWLLIAMSYGRVEYDRFAFLVALAVLPTCGAARWRDRTPTPAGGWGLRMVQLAVVATYFLAACVKLRFAGLDWLTGGVLARAVVQHGTPLAYLIASVPGVLLLGQFTIIVFELLSPLVFGLPERWRRWVVAFFYSFHLATTVTIGIAFAPHLVAMLGFFPLERGWDRMTDFWQRRVRRSPLNVVVQSAD